MVAQGILAAATSAFFPGPAGCEEGSMQASAGMVRPGNRPAFEASYESGSVKMD
jgi:hypothetical protein